MAFSDKQKEFGFIMSSSKELTRREWNNDGADHFAWIEILNNILLPVHLTDI